MNSKHVRTLLNKLNDYCAKSLEDAATFANTRSHYDVTIEHMVIKLMEEGGGDFERILNHFNVNSDKLWQDILDNISKYPADNQGKPNFSSLLFQWLEHGYVAGSLHYHSEQIRSLGLMDALIEYAPMMPGNAFEQLDAISLDTLRKDFKLIIDGTVEAEGYVEPVINLSNTSKNQQNASSENNTTTKNSQQGETALSRFTENITLKATSGKIDPVLGRDEEIRLVIDILSRRRKNNPILVGDPGVGKTALVEGLALRIAEGTVPDELKNIHIHTLDLGLLQAGAGVKGEFEKRLKQVIDEVKNSLIPIVMFIDEAHTLIGAGGEAGMSDAANLLKPALARGELRTLAATTWSEYKKYFERDAALERRFQLVKVDEPSIEKAMVMLNGIKNSYQNHHKILITDEAIEAAVKLSSRYINGRYLPDKAIDLLDTAAARIRMGQAAKPSNIESAQSHILYIEKRLAQLDEESRDGLIVDEKLIQSLKEDLVNTREKLDKVQDKWQQEFSLVETIKNKKTELVQELNNNKGIENKKSRLLRKQNQTSRAELLELQADSPMVQVEVNAAAVAEIISDWTGVPVNNMRKDDVQALIAFESRIGDRVVGQIDAVASIGKAIRSARAGLNNPDAPLGVFLLVGPSGVGKTETARAIAEELLGGERFLITINMSEYQEAHTVSQLKGSPPGYIGYGEGGVLTEAVRKRPYSVVLLDEVEKAHSDVMNMFYQVFDRGFMRDGEGREIDFKNTIILMTSNLASENIIELCTPPQFDGATINDSTAIENTMPEWTVPSNIDIKETIQPILLQRFQPALLGRMQVVPYVPLDKAALTAIVALKLDHVAQRLKTNHSIAFRCSEDVIHHLAERCQQTATGARYINSLIDHQLLPEIARNVLTYMLEDDMPDFLTMELDELGELSMVFADSIAEKNEQNLEQVI